MDDKAALRARMAAIRDGIAADERAAKSAAIARRLVEWPQFAGARTVLAFLSTRSEVLTAPIIVAALQQGKLVGAPRTRVGDRRLDFRQLRDPAGDLTPGPFGILEPGPAAPPVDPARADVILVPGLGFDQRGYRVGYGGGFYDRLLQLTTGATVGIAFDEQVLETLPYAGHDRPVQWIVTDQRLIRCEGGGHRAP